MNPYQVINNQLIQDLISSFGDSLTSAKGLTTGATSQGLQNLINSIPYYQESVSQSALKSALINIFENNLPNSSITAQPSESGPWYAPYSTSYSYNGNYSGYKDAFFTGISLNASANSILTQVGNSANSSFWSVYSVALLTDAIRQQVPVSLDSNALPNALSSYGNNITRILSPAYLGIFINGYTPTQNAINAIQDKIGAAHELDTAIANGQFTANINQALSIPGDSACAATWFLFNLWITLKALGMPNVDAAISSYKQQGLSIPIQVDAGNWWNGSYGSWFSPLDGSYVSSPTITASMPEVSYTYFPQSGGYPSKSYENASNGYSMSLCDWGDLSYYKPQSSSCFGGDTLVLMADGTTKKISEINIGENIYTRNGAKKVILVESPLRGERELYSINALEIYATCAHPFKSHSKVVAINPWLLKDTITTFGDVGVDYLKVGTIINGKDSEVEVKSITTINNSYEGEKVFDLIIEGASTGHYGYFVGSEEVFLEVYSESANPLAYPYVSTTIIHAMNTIKTNCCIIDSKTKLRNILPAINIGAIEPNLSVGNSSLASIPSIEFFLKEGRWDEDSSFLEHHLIASLSKNIRRKIESGYKISQKSAMGDFLCIGINDIDLVGREVNEGKISFMLKPQDDEVIEYKFQPSSKYAPKIDDVVYVKLSSKPNSIYIYFMDLQAHINLENINQRYSDYFLYDQNGQISGSINLDFRFLNIEDVLCDQKQKSCYGKQDKTNVSVALGNELYLSIAALLKVRKEGDA